MYATIYQNYASIEYHAIKYQQMKKCTLKLYDKIITAILFSTIFLLSCKPYEPVPAYGGMPMYGVIQPKAYTIKKDQQTTKRLPNEKTYH